MSSDGLPHDLQSEVDSPTYFYTCGFVCDHVRALELLHKEKKFYDVKWGSCFVLCQNLLEERILFYNT